MKGEQISIGKKQLTNHDIMVHFPKIELHRHLEGSFDLPMLHKISLRNKLDVPTNFDDFKTFVQFPRDSGPDFLKFLSKFKTDWYRNFRDIEEISYHSIANLVKDGLYYIELRFNPEHFALYNNFDRKLITKIVIEQGNIAAKETGLNLKYLITFNRMKQTSSEMIRLYDELRNLEIPDIVGIDLAGDEVNFPPEMFVDFFNYVNNDNKYLITIHAGEVSPSSQIWQAIELLHPKRIGHGTSTITDVKLQKELIRREITLEQCITSNYQTGSWADESTHPLGRLYKSGVPTSINSDDPSIQDADLTDDYIKAVTNFDLTLDDLIKLNHMAIRASFVTESEKAILKNGYDKSVQDFITRFSQK